MQSVIYWKDPKHRLPPIETDILIYGKWDGKLAVTVGQFTTAGRWETYALYDVGANCDAVYEEIDPVVYWAEFPVIAPNRSRKRR